MPRDRFKHTNAPSGYSTIINLNYRWENEKRNTRTEEECIRLFKIESVPSLKKELNDYFRVAFKYFFKNNKCEPSNLKTKKFNLTKHQCKAIRSIFEKYSIVFKDRDLILKEINNKFKKCLKITSHEENGEKYYKFKYFYMKRYIRYIEEFDFRKKPNIVKIGAKVTLYDEEFDEDVIYTLISSSEGDPVNGIITASSPLGKAILGKNIGSKVFVKIKDNLIAIYKIKRIENPN